MDTCISRLIRAPRHQVYATCLDPEKLVQWRVPHGMQAHIDYFDARVGGRYRMSLSYTDPADAGRGKSSSRTDSFIGEFLEIEADRKIVEAIVFESDDPAFGGRMMQTLEFEDKEGGTLVSLRHENLPVGIRPEDNETGCRMALENLARLMQQTF